VQEELVLVLAIMGQKLIHVVVMLNAVKDPLVAGLRHHSVLVVLYALDQVLIILGVPPGVQYTELKEYFRKFVVATITAEHILGIHQYMDSLQCANVLLLDVADVHSKHVVDFFKYLVPVDFSQLQLATGWECMVTVMEGSEWYVFLISNKFIKYIKPDLINNSVRFFIKYISILWLVYQL
jgi:hypothetical protein